MLKRTFLTLAALAALTSGPALAQPAPGDAPMLSPTTSGYAPVNGVEVYYQVYGKGDPLVLLHGGFGAIEMFTPILGALAEDHTVIGVDLQGHGRTLPHDRRMTFESMASDVADLISHLGYDKADILGYSVGGMVALQVGLNHPEVVDKLVVVSAPYARSGWHEYNIQGMSQIGAGSAEFMKQSPMYEMYKAVAPDPEANWVKLHTQMGELVNTDYDYSTQVKGLTVPTMIVIGDHDSVRPAHAVAFFELLGGGLVDAEWDYSKMVQHRLAILPGLTHYDIFMSPALAAAALSFIDAPTKQ